MASAKYKKTTDLWNKTKNKKGVDKSKKSFILTSIYTIN